MTKTDAIAKTKAYATTASVAAGTALVFVLSQGAAKAQQNDPLLEGANASRPAGEAGQTTLFEEGGLFQIIVNTLLFIVGAISVIMLIIGGIRYVVSAGDSTAVNGAKNTILYAIVGIVIAFLAFAAVNFVIGQLNA